MSPFYRLAAIVLLGAAVLATSWVMQSNPAAPWRMPEPVRDSGSTGSPEPSDNPQRGDAGQRLTNQELELLSTRTLFRPERTETVDMGDTAAAGPAPGQAAMELIGVGIIGDEEAAVITVTRTASRSRFRRGSAAAPESPKATRHVYRVGSEVADTGYELKEIRLDEVVLVKGGEELILRLDPGAASSQERVVAAQKEREAKQRVDSAQEAEPENRVPLTPPPPPPPPVPGTAAVGTPATPGETAAGGNVDREKIRQILLERRRLLEERRKALLERQAPK